MTPKLLVWLFFKMLAVLLIGIKPMGAFSTQYMIISRTIFFKKIYNQKTQHWGLPHAHQAKLKQV
ncbi:hypothetical protein D0U04_30340 [Bacillus clarus]|uniref:Uncharacterized protein n=1 Tax=Bacillus clarus TaxID=2338372 RepID=A0A090YD23_9BACI|nr:hypothetical protein DJ93_5374 [Bacillus clarus]RFT61529.1 hypothetical protein D0U04_30340 [Bacillus clarus]